jgi:acetyl-CoA acetyltransferase
VNFEAVGCSLRGRGSWDQRVDYPTMSNVDAAAQMWSRTDLRPSDVDVAELYDGFTFLTLSWLEALGFCKQGEGGPFVDQGKRIALGGELPLNTYGGQLSAGRLHGNWLVHEAVTQLRWEATGRQVQGCEVAVMSAAGAPSTGCMLFTRG